MITRNLGYEGIIWALGKVEDITDPLMLGRMRVRVFSEHDTLDVEDLPWAHPLLPITSASLAGVGQSPTGIAVGSYVILMYLDSTEKQKPIVLGSLGKIPNYDINLHDVSKLARGIGNDSNSLGPEPKRAFAAQYPYNKVTQTLSGHVFELDDTPDQERINLQHKSGTYTEINNIGRKVDKVVSDNYIIIQGNDTVYVKGNVNIEIIGNCTLKVSSLDIETNINVEGNLDISGNLDVSGDVNITGNVLIQGRRLVLE